MQLDTVLIKVANRCNINCKYCYVYNMGDTGWAEMPAQISLETVQDIALKLREFMAERQKPLAIVLHGGEPLLLGVLKLKQVLQILRKNLPFECSLGLQTNGILLSKQILDVCAEMRTTISVSLDGPKYIHDKERVGHDGQGTFDKVINGIQLLSKHENADFLFSGLLAVIDPKSDPAEIYHFLKGFNAPGVDFLYRDGNHSSLPVGKNSFISTEYGEWFVRLFNIYITDTNPLRIRFLDDLIKLILGGTNQKDGVGLTDFGVLIFETDGSIAKNDTLKSTFNGADRFTKKWSARTHRLSQIIETEEYREYHKLQRPSSSVCFQCPELRICGGGMTLHRWRDDNGYDNPSIYCRDQQLLIGYIRHCLTVIQNTIEDFPAV